MEIEQLAHISPEEKKAVDDLVQTLVQENRPPENQELQFLRTTPNAVDIALFGRMLAAKPRYNVEAACQVAHSITVHAVTVEDDYFTAVDDLNEGKEDRGAAHIGETGFAAGLFYSYVCINRDLLLENLGGNEHLADRAIAALAEVAAKVSPQGKQNSFATRAYASYILVEKGPQQPRSLSVAFLKPVQGTDYGHEAIKALEKQRQEFENTYGPCADDYYILNSVQGMGNLQGLQQFMQN